MYIKCSAGTAVCANSTGRILTINWAEIDIYFRILMLLFVAHFFWIDRYETDKVPFRVLFFM